MMNSERKEVKELYEKLRRQKKLAFPEARERLEAPKKHGVYIIYQGKKVIHIGRTLRAKNGLHQRLMNHLHGNSSLTINEFNGSGTKLRKGFKYRCLEVECPRKRALLEAYAIGYLCPNYIGLGV